MEQEELRRIQAPLKKRYSEQPEAALVTLAATGTLGEGISCSVATGRALAAAGLHPASGGDGTLLCSGDMLLEALAACAGVTLRAVATSIDVPVRGGTVNVEGDLDTDATDEQLDTLLRLTERYCVVLQTIVGSPIMTLDRTVANV